MQKIKFLLLFLITGMYSLSAQSSFFGGIGGGFYSSVIVGQQNYGQRDLASDYKFSPAYGIHLGMDFNNMHIVQIDPTFINIGANYKPSPNTANLDRDVSLSYLHIPLSYRFVIKGGSNGMNAGTRFFIGAGPYFNILTNADMTTTVRGNDASLYAYLTEGGGNKNIIDLNVLMPNQMNPEYKEMFNSLDLGAMIMFGGQSFLTENLKLSYEIRAGYSLTDINAENWRLPNIDGNYDGSRNLFAGIHIGLSYYF
jgi:hypothetical protein